MREGPAPPLVTVVSGCSRSGTSLMMPMLAAGGLNVLVDDAQATDEHNPRCYYELGASLGLKGDAATEWVTEARGKAVDAMAYHLEYLPEHVEYRVTFMRRVIAEVLHGRGQRPGQRGGLRAAGGLARRKRLSAGPFRVAGRERHARVVRHAGERLPGRG